MKDLNNSLASKDKSLRQSRKSSSSPSPSPSSGYRDDQPLIDPQQYATPDQYGYSPETASQRYSPEGVPQQQQQQQQQQQGQHNTLSDTERQRYQEEFEQRYYSESVPLDYSHETQQYNSESATVPSEGETRNSYAEGEESRGGAGGGPWPSRMSLGSLVGYLMSGAAKKVGLTKGPKLPEYERPKDREEGMIHGAPILHKVTTMGAASTPNSSSDSTTSSLSPSSHDFDTTTQAEVYPTIPEEEEEEPVVEPLYQTSMADVVKTAIENKGKIRALDKAKAKKEREEEKQRLKREKEEEKLRQKKEKEEEKLKAKREKEETKLKAEQEKEEKRLKAEHEKEENMLRAEQEKEENMMQRLKTEGKQTVVQIDAHVEGDAKNQASNVASHALNNITSGASSVLHYQGGVAATPSGSTINMTTGENNIGNSAVQDLPLIKEKVSHEMKNRVLNNKAKEKSEKDYEYHPTQTTEMALDETLKTTSSGPPSYMVSKEEDVDENIADKQYSPSSPIATEKTNGELKFPRMISEQVQSDKADTPTNIIRNSRSESDELSGKVNVKSPRSNEKSPDGVLQSMSSGGGPKGKSSSKGRSDSSDGKLMNEVSLTSGSNSFSATKKSKERSNVSRPSSKDRPSFSRPTSKERPGFSRPTSKERPGFSRPTSKERPGFSRPTSKERPGFSRPTSKERPGLSRPTSKDRPTLSRPTSKERPTKSGKSSRSASRDRSATMSQEKVPLESVKEAANESSHHHHKRQQKQRQSRPTSREPRSAESSKILKAQASERLHSGDLTLPPASSPKPAKMIRHSHTSTEFKPSFQEKQENQEDNVTTSSGPKTSVLENRENQEKNVAKLYKKLTGKNKESEMHVPETSKVIFNNDGVQSSLKTKDTEDNVYNTSRSLEPPKVQTSSTKDIIVKNIPSDTKTDEELNPVKSEEQELKSTNSENEGIKMTKSEEQELKNSAKGELVQKDDTHSNSSKMSSGSDTESHRSLVAITAEENLMYSRGQSPRPGSSFSQHSQSKSGDVQSTTKFHTQVIRSLKDNQSPYKMQPQVTKPPSSTDVTNGGTDRVRDKSVSQPAMSKPSPTGQSILRDGETGSVVVAAGGGQASAAPASALLEVEPGGGIVKNATSEVLKSSVQASDDVGRTIVIKPRGYEEPPVLKTIARSNHVLHTTSNTEGTGQTSTSSSTAAGPQNRSVREDVLVKGLEESVKYNSGDRISLSNSPGQNAMPYQVNPRGSTLSAVEVPEGTINTVSLAVSQGGSNPVRPIPVREHFSVPTSSIFDRKTSNPSFSGSSLWHKARPLVVRPSLDSYFREPREYEDFLPREPVRPVLQRRSSLGKIDVPDPYDDYYYDDYEDENARLDRLRESRGSQTVRVKNQQPRHSILKKTDYKPPPPPKKEDLRPLVLDKLEEYRNTPPIIIASGLVPKNLESLTSEYQAKNPDGGTHKNSTTTNDNTLANNYSNNQRTAANNRNNHQGSKDKDQNFQDLRYQHDLSSTQGAAITAPLVASQQKQNIGDVFNRLHNNRRAEQGLVAPKKSESKTKTKAIPGKASKDFGTAITTTFRGPAPEPQRRHQQNVGHDVFSRLYENRKRRNEMGETARLLDLPSNNTTQNSLQPGDAGFPIRKDGVKGTTRTTKDYGHRTARGDTILDMPMLAPDIVVDDGSEESSPVHGGGMDQQGKGSSSDKLPIVLLQGFFRGPGAASPHHRRPSVTVNELTLPPHLVDVTSVIRGALPVLPRSLAALCLTLNIVLPGLGTAASGWLGLCWGRNRMGAVETSGHRFTSVLVTGATGLVQLFTVTFFLVGWFWGVAWGILLVSIANKYKQFLSEHRTSIAGGVSLEMLAVNAS